jgi:rhodanese-related sulfurtransferase
MLACAKFLSRVEEIEAQPTCWLGLVHDPAGQNSSSSNTPSTSSAGDEDTLWDVVRRAAITQSNAPRNPYTPPKGAVSIDDVLARARGQLERLSPQQAYDALLAPARATGMTDDGGSGGGAEGGGDGEGVEDAPPALLIDIRPASQRAVHGGIHGSLLIERNVLEWRLDPRSAARLSIADRYDLRAIVLCQEGYTSSLAAAALQEIGLWNATDVVGGYEAWKNAGLPTELNVAVWEGEEGEESEDGRSEMAPSSLISGTSMGDGVDKQGW